MSARGLEDLIRGALALALLFSVVCFAKAMLSDTVAIFLAGLGIGAIGALAIRMFPSRS